MSGKIPKPNNTETELRVTKEKLKISLKKEIELNAAKKEIEIKNAEIRKITEEKSQLFTELELKKQELDFIKKALDQKIQEVESNNKKGKILSFFSDIFSVFGAGFIAWGTNLLTSTSPNLVGWPLIIAGVLLLLINSIMTKVLGFGGLR